MRVRATKDILADILAQAHAEASGMCDHAATNSERWQSERTILRHARWRVLAWLESDITCCPIIGEPSHTPKSASKAGFCLVGAQHSMAGQIANRDSRNRLDAMPGVEAEVVIGTLFEQASRAYGKHECRYRRCGMDVAQQR